MSEGSSRLSRLRQPRWIALIAGILVAAIVAVLGFRHTSKPQHFTAAVERGDIHDVVQATGTINAVVTVQVGSQVSGTIARLNADFNGRVHKGDVIALIDPALFEGAVSQASADVDNAQANVTAARANLEKEKAAALQSRNEYARTLELVRANLASQQQLDVAKANADSASSSVGAAAANVEQALAQVKQTAATLAIARTNLNYTVIRSPIDGTVVARNVELGQTVAASLQAPTIFTIAQDLTKMLVYTKTDESDVGQIRPGRPVTFKVDAFPKETFEGVVDQVRMNPTTVQNVVTYDTIISFVNRDMKLFPGMTAYVTIPVATVRDVEKIPNTALRYKPPYSPEEIREIYKARGISVDEPRTGAEEKAAAGGPSAPAALAKSASAASAVVWKLLPDGRLDPVQVSLGITDHSYTQVTRVAHGALEPGQELVIRSIVSKSQVPGGIRR
jgi:HlyD family secretion protein